MRAGEQQERADIERWAVLPSKLRPPTVRADLLPRPALVDRLRATQAPIVLLRAGPGYGKTTVAWQWTEADHRPVAWVALDGGDDDPLVFLRHVARALHEIEPLPAVEAALTGPRPRLRDRALPALAAALDSGREPFVLVLDDVHLVGSLGTLDVLERLVDMVPPGSQLVLVSRSTPPLRVSRRILDGGVFELDQSDLAFADVEARAVLTGALPDLDDATIGAVIEATDCWPAGVHLAVLALRDNPRLRERIRSLGVADRHVAAYFHEEFLARLDPPTRSFLVRTAVLDRFTAPLCDAVLGEHGSQAVLDRLLESGNLFVAHLAADDIWFRYHHLFHELLLAELRRTTPELEPGLRRRAAAWLGDRRLSEAAVAQAVATGDPGFAGRVIHGQLPVVIATGAVASVGRWLSAFTTDEVRQEPYLALVEGWQAFTQLDGAELGYWLGVAEQHGEAMRAQGESTDQFDLSLAALRMVGGVGGVRRILESARLVLERGRSGSVWWPLAVLLEATALVAAHEDADALALFTSVEVETRSFPAAHVAALANLAVVHLLAGNDDHARAALDAAGLEAEIEGLDDFAPLLLLPCARALAAARRRALAESVRWSEIAERAVTEARTAVPRGAAHARLVLTEAALARGDHEGAARNLARSAPPLALEPDAKALHAWAARLKAQVERWDDHLVQGLTPSERRVLDELATHRSLVEIAQQLNLSRNTVKTHAVSIYRKLGVSKRNAAVERARELRLLDG